jgi:hypothetical protein
VAGGNFISTPAKFDFSYTHKPKNTESPLKKRGFWIYMSIMRGMATYSMKEIKHNLLLMVTDPGLSDERVVEIWCKLNNKWGCVERGKDGEPFATIKNDNEEN